MIPWLQPGDPPDAFPPVESALTDPDGLLCAGGDLAPARLLEAYRRGIFPWYSAEQPILWWSPDPRTVLYPGEFRISRSLAKTLRNRGFAITLDQSFAAVMEHCADPSLRPEGTWISPQMRAGYQRLHELGYAHSVEVRLDGRLVGGLYGVALGRMFYGESMFSRAVDASKVALVALVERLQARGFPLIDCQVRTPLLAALGAREIPRRDFLRRLTRLVNYSGPAQEWQTNDAGMVCAPARRAGSGKR